MNFIKRLGMTIGHRLYNSFLIRAFSVMGLVSALTCTFGDKAASQDIDDYLQDEGFAEIVNKDINQYEDVRVYYDNPLEILHEAGIGADRAGQKLAKSVFENEGFSISKAFVQAAGTAISYPITLFQITFSGISDLNAFALPGFKADDTCYINPLDEISVREYIDQFTSIPEEHQTKFINADSIDMRLPVFIHELQHCNQIGLLDYKEMGLGSHTLEGESNSDKAAYDTLKGIDKYDEILKVMIHSRAISILSRDHYSGSHSTSIITDAHIHGDKAPTREQANYNYAHLHELVQKKINSYETNDDEDNTHYQYVYVALKELLAESEEMTPYMMRAAELYIEAVEYLAKDSPLFENKNSQEKSVSHKNNTEALRPAV